MRAWAWVWVCFSGFVPEMAAAQASFSLDTKESKIGFTISTNLKEIQGTVQSFTGSLDTPNGPQDISTKASGTITAEASSMTTKNEKINKEMRGSVFESDKFPTITLALQELSPKSETRYQVSAKLTLHGVTKPIRFWCDVRADTSKEKMTLSLYGKTKVKLSDFGMQPPSSLFVKVSDSVELTWSLVAKQQ
jgi:polyisoprenoid-binding protein YceI